MSNFKQIVVTGLVLMMVLVLPLSVSAKGVEIEKSLVDKTVKRFIEYTKFDSTSKDSSNTCPTSPGQIIFAKKLVEDLKAIGLSDAALDAEGFVFATLPANTDASNIPVIGFIAHVDTSESASGANVKARVVRGYDGGDIVLNKEKNIVLSTRISPELKEYRGDDIIVTDGTTLLGVDDKGGIVEIFAALEYLNNHPEIKHGVIRVAFTPDEETGRCIEKFDVAKFGAKFAYTIDGGAVGGLEYENFNAAFAAITIKGLSVHPGTAKGKMINASLLAMEYNGQLPPETPSNTEGYEGYYHLTGVESSTDKATFGYLIRDHDWAKFEARKQKVEEIAVGLNAKYGEGTVTVKIEDSYYNMRQKIEPIMYIVDIAKMAMREVGTEPRITPFRGGTDGSILSFKGLPTPNIFTGGHNLHGPLEYLPVNSMKKAAETIVKIAEITGRGVPEAK